MQILAITLVGKVMLMEGKRWNSLCAQFIFKKNKCLGTFWIHSRNNQLCETEIKYFVNTLYSVAYRLTLAEQITAFQHQQMRTSGPIHTAALYKTSTNSGSEENISAHSLFHFKRHAPIQSCGLPWC